MEVQAMCILLILALITHLAAARSITGQPLNGTVAAPETCRQLWVSIAVSPLIETSSPRALEVSWGNADPKPGDWVGLFSGEPQTSSVPDTPLARMAAKHESGLLLSDTEAPIVNSSALGYTKRCFGFWAAYVRDNNTVLALTCLGTQPTWMTDSKEELSHLRLRNIFIPGTHDSGSYKKYRPGMTETYINKYSITQEEDVLSQLIHGVRYIDLRIGHHSVTREKWWVNHGVVRFHPLRHVLDSIRAFLTNTSEIVILDAQEFRPGFGSGNSEHAELVWYLQEHLGDLMASPTLTWDATLGDIWAAGSRLIMSYDNPDMVNGSAILWPAVYHQWGNVQTVEALHTFLEKNTNRSLLFLKPTSAMAQLTARTWDVITDKLGGLRRMADAVSRDVSAWYRGSWGRTVNVVAVDFYKSTAIVEVALEWNRRRARNITC